MNLATDHGFGRTTAALLGSLPLSVALSTAVSRLLPFELELRFALGFFGFFAIWPLAICCLFLARSGVRAWAAVVLLTALASGVAMLGEGIV